MLKRGIIIPCVSSWSSPITLVPKRDGTFRFCVDYRKLNAITKDDAFPIPRLDEPLTLMKNCDRFSVMDCDQCYFQIPMAKNSMEKTTFTCHLGTFLFKVMPFGVKGGPASCVRAMSEIFKTENRKISFIYMDDLICFSKGVKEHIRRLSILLQRMQEHGLKLKAKKCSFLMEKVKYLGHSIDSEGIRPDMDRVKDVINKPKPTDQKTLKSFLGFMGFYRIFIKNFSIIAEPLLRLLKKNIEFIWTEEQDTAYETLKSKLLSDPILIHFDPNNPIELRVDASNSGLGAHLTQIIKDKPHLLACASRVLSSNERNYSTSEKECLAIVWSVNKFRQYLYGRKFTVITDHAGLQYLMNTKDLTNRLARWSL